MSGEMPVPVRVPGQVRATGIVAAGMMAMNLLTYAFSLLCARRLGPNDFGAVSALLGVMIVANVGALALQATAARRLATALPQHRGAVTRDIVRHGMRVALAFGLLLAVAAPLLNGLFHLDSWTAAFSPAVACVPLTLMGAFAGVLQGERRWGALSVVYGAVGVGRIAVGGAAVAIEPSLASAMIGVTLGSTLPALLGAAYCRVHAAPADDHEPIVGELWRNGHTLLALFALTNLDVLLARHLFEEQQSGVYAAGAILTKACLFLPTFVLVVAFPTMAADRGGRPWLRPLLAVAAVGACAVVGTRLLPDLAVSFVGGSAYAELGEVAWLFALEGTLFAIVQILVYDTIADQSHSASVLWLGVVVVLAVAVPLIDSVESLVSLVALVAFGVALVTSLMPGATHPD